jgi:hypothetical protein
MKKYDELFTVDDDPVWDNVEPAKPKKKGRERIVGPFYQCSVSWLDAAAEVAGAYLILAVRLYVRWRKRKLGTDAIWVMAATLDGPGHSKRGRAVVVRKLEAAGLIEVVERARRGRAPKVRIVDPQLQS